MWLGNEECHVTWEREDTIPKNVLQEFEGGVVVEVQEVSAKKIGQTSCTLFVNTHENEEGPKSKRLKAVQNIVQGNDG